MVRRKHGSAIRFASLIAVAATLLLAAPASAQLDASPRRGASRAALDSLAELYSLAEQSPAYSEVLRREARDAAASIERRLEEGDFRPGDRVEVRVEEYPELNDTLSVGSDRVLQVPGVGEVALEGVLRSELEQHLSSAVARVIRNPRLRAKAFVRLSLSGAFNAPGFYLVDSDLPIADVFMTAGGQARDGDLERARVERAGDVVVTPSALQDALRSGATVEELGLREGDEVHMPAERSWFQSAREWLFVIPSIIGLLALLR